MNPQRHTIYKTRDMNLHTHNSKKIICRKIRTHEQIFSGKRKNEFS